MKYLRWYHRLLGHLGQRYWNARIGHVLSEAKQYGWLDNLALHELDYRLKYDPERKFEWAAIVRKRARET